VQPAKKVHVNGAGEYWGVLVEAKIRANNFRVASELTGMEGMVEATTWEQVFTVASRADNGSSSSSAGFAGAGAGASAVAKAAVAGAAGRDRPKSVDKGNSSQRPGKPSRDTSANSGNGGSNAANAGAGGAYAANAAAGSKSAKLVQVGQMVGSALVVGSAAFVTNKYRDSQLVLVLVALLSSVLIMLIYNTTKK
jgi:hypothetical protein